MVKVRTRKWDPADYLETDARVAAYLNAVLEDGDAALVTAALGDIARAKGMSKIATDAGLGRESLYKALSQDGNPEFATVLSVIRALGLRLLATPAKKTARRIASPSRRATEPIARTHESRKG
jgi:probable addiction module antidote protein